MEARERRAAALMEEAEENEADAGALPAPLRRRAETIATSIDTVEENRLFLLPAGLHLDFTFPKTNPTDSFHELDHIVHRVLCGIGRCLHL
ncbi:hypothetical protein WME99_22870 [Sorangium sp. So ce136]|uniref:hypothetical protein n=1 Tax=Sorangium sp. So ce136 TaxID=3133284 RepID=UPI003EFFF166